MKFNIDRVKQLITSAGCLGPPEFNQNVFVLEDLKYPTGINGGVSLVTHGISLEDNGIHNDIDLARWISERWNFFAFYTLEPYTAIVENGTAIHHKLRYAAFNANISEIIDWEGNKVK